MWVFRNYLLHTQTVANGPPIAKFAPLAQTSSYATAHRLKNTAQTPKNPVEKSSLLRQSSCFATIAAIPDGICDYIYSDNFNHRMWSLNVFINDFPLPCQQGKKQSCQANRPAKHTVFCALIASGFSQALLQESFEQTVGSVQNTSYEAH